MILLINKEMKLHIRDPNASLTKSPRMVCFSLDCSEKKLAPLKDLLSSLLIRTSEDSKSIRPPNENKRDQYLGGDNTLFSKKKKPKHSNSGYSYSINLIAGKPALELKRLLISQLRNR